MTSPNIWAPGTAISANNSLKSQSFVASAGQTVFTLTAFLYAVSTGSLQVYVGGLHQRSGIDFNETSPNSFTLTTGVSAGTIVTAVAAVEVSGSVDLAGAIAALEAHKLATSTHGVGTVVGATETQTLSNKTLVNPSISDGTFVGPTLTSPIISGGSAADTLFENVQINEATINGFYLTGSYAPIAVVDGGTGASSAETARGNLDVPSRSGVGASGTWNIDITGTAAAASSAVTADKLSTASGSAPSYSARAWVNFNGTGTIGTNQTIRASGNVASVYKNGTGDYTITFTTSMPDANYAVSGAWGPASTYPNNAHGCIQTVSLQAASVRIRTLVASGTLDDSTNIDVVIFR